jgi:hypothetical protein
MTGNSLAYASGYDQHQLQVTALGSERMPGSFQTQKHTSQNLAARGKNRFSMHFRNLQIFQKIPVALY